VVGYGGPASAAIYKELNTRDLYIPRVAMALTASSLNPVQTFPKICEP